MKKVSEKNVKAILGEFYYPAIVRCVQDGAWTNSLKVVKEKADWVLFCEARTAVDGGWEAFPLAVETDTLKRQGLVTMKRQLEAAFVRKPHLVKSDLDKWWAKQVAERDNHNCVNCAETKLMQAHHWYVNASKSKMARWDTANGVLLCFTCHIRAAHECPDYRLYRKFYEHVRRKSCRAAEGTAGTPAQQALSQRKTRYKKVIARMDTLADTKPTDQLTRRLWVEHCASEVSEAKRKRT